MKTLKTLMMGWVLAGSLAQGQIYHQKPDPSPLVQAALDLKVDVATFTAYQGGVAGSLGQKQDVSTAFTKATADTLYASLGGTATALAGKASNASVALKADIAALATKADASTVTALSNTVSGKASLTQLNSGLALKLDAEPIVDGSPQLIIGNTQGRFFDASGSAHNAIYANAADSAGVADSAQYYLNGYSAGALNAFFGGTNLEFFTTPEKAKLAQNLATVGDLSAYQQTAGLGNLAFYDSGDFAMLVEAPSSFATAAQGALASTAVQPAQLAGKADKVQVNIYSTAGTATWTQPEGAKFLSIVIIGAGAGGGSGRKGLAGGIRCGGGAGGGGGYSTLELDASLLGATETVTVGAGGAGAAAQTTNSTNGINAPNAGAGGTSSFGSWARATAGGGGNGGTATTGTGGAAGIGEQSSTAGVAASTTGLVGAGGTNAPNAKLAAGGAASGGGITAANVASAGGAGGTSPSIYFSEAGGLGGAISASGAQPLVTRAAGDWRPGPGSGGGGSSLTGNGGAGAAGKFPGQGGGGGGAAVDGIGNSGAGGAGANGLVIVITHF